MKLFNFYTKMYKNEYMGKPNNIITQENRVPFPV